MSHYANQKDAPWIELQRAAGYSVVFSKKPEETLFVAVIYWASQSHPSDCLVNENLDSLRAQALQFAAANVQTADLQADHNPEDSALCNLANGNPTMPLVNYAHRTVESLAKFHIPDFHRV